jgi:hypothetical protein
MRLVNFSPLRRSFTIGYLIGIDPVGVSIFLSDSDPLRTTCRRPSLPRKCLNHSMYSATFSDSVSI